MTEGGPSKESGQIGALVGARISDVSGLLIDIEPDTRHRRYWAIVDLESGERWVLTNEDAHLLTDTVEIEKIPAQDMSGLGAPTGERIEAVFTRRSSPSSPGAPAWKDQLFLLLESGRLMALVLLSGGGSALHLESFADSPLIRRTDRLISPTGVDATSEIWDLRL